MEEQLTIGRIVHYSLSPQDVVAIDEYHGYGVNPHAEGQVVPAIVVVPHAGGSFNGQAFLDGNIRLWLTSIPYNEEGAPGTWHWPPRV